MKLLLDECTPKRLRLDFSGHTVHTVEEAGLKELKNGELLRVASSKFDVLITVNKNIPLSGLDKRRMQSYVSINAPSHAHMARLRRDEEKQGSTNEPYSCADRR